MSQPAMSPPVTRGTRTHQTVLQSVRVAAAPEAGLRPARPAWCTLPSGRLAAACVADHGDVVVLSPTLSRLGRLPLGDLLGRTGAVHALAGARGLRAPPGPPGVLVVAGADDGGVALVDADGDAALVPMRKKITANVDGLSTRRAARVVATLAARHSSAGHPVDAVAAAWVDGAGLVVASACCAAGEDGLDSAAVIVAWALPEGCDAGEEPPALAPEMCARDGVVVHHQRDARVLTLEASPREGGVVRLVAALENGVIAVDVSWDALAARAAELRQLKAVEPGRFGPGRPQWEAEMHAALARGVPAVLSWPSGAMTDFGRILRAADAGGDFVVFGGEDDCVYWARLDRRVGLGGASLDVDAPPPGARRHRQWLVQHGSFVGGLAVRDGMVASAAWDGKVMVSPLPVDNQARAGAGEGADAVAVAVAGAGADADVGGMECRVSESLVVQDAGAGKTFWHVEWVEPGVLYAAVMENVEKRCLLYRIELLTAEEDSGEGSEATAGSLGYPVAAVAAARADGWEAAAAPLADGWADVPLPIGTILGPPVDEWPSGVAESAQEGGGVESESPQRTSAA